MTKGQLQAELNEALNKKELVLYYQPQFNVTTSRFDALEALLRWRHPRLGLLLPDDFLPMAEASGLIVSIGEWVMNTACEQSRLWINKGLPAVRMAVNVSGPEIEQPDFVKKVMAKLSQYQLAPSMLEIELTENIILDNENLIVSQIHQLKQLGVSIALDDFGTGYSSISYLKKIPVNRIKIDKSFIERINEDNSDATIVRAIVALAAGLNLQVLAEGVETLKQLQTLLSLECKEVQGFYFSEPLTADEVEKALVSYKKSSGE